MLEEYKKKRYFKEITEPAPEDLTITSDRSIFVIQKHNARTLHYDFRLEIDGVLKSWTIPKEPPKKANVKRLAIQTEDHPLEYVNFEGIIPEGQYGAGVVEIWDKGTFILRKIEDKEIVFTLDGEKLKGDYVLIKAKFGVNENSWLFFKKKSI